MKSLLNSIVLFLVMTFCADAFGQSPTEPLSNTNDDVKILNLYHLSKIIADNNISSDAKNKAYYAVKTITNSNKLNAGITKEKHPEVTNFMEQHDLFYSEWISTLLLNINVFKEPAHKKILDTYKELKSKLENIETREKEISNYRTKIESYNKFINDLGDSYSDTEFNLLTDSDVPIKILDYFTKKDGNWVIKDVIMLKEELKKRHSNLKIIDSLKEEFTAGEFKKISDNNNEIKKDLSSYYTEFKEVYHIKNRNLITKIIAMESTVLQQNMNDEQSKLDNDKKTFINQYKEKYTLIPGKTELFTLSKIPQVSDVPAKQQIIINSQIHTAQMQAGASGLSIPSQTQMIDAMAMFLAKRAKQEAAIWFIDQVRLQMNNPLVMDVFPETIKIIDGTGNYKVPTFNIPWKKAIATDFVEMPKNLAKSPWVESVILNDNQKQIAMLKQSIDFGYDLNRLMTEQYNYRDVIRYFYINERDSVKDNPNASATTKDSKLTLKINTAINNSATLLYIITNELFAIEKVNGNDIYRLVSYEEISGLSPQEYKILLELIDLKYGDRLKQLKNQYSIINNVEKKEHVSKWVGKILISLSQFDKIRTEYAANKDKNNKDLSSKNFYNVWSILNQLSENIYDVGLFPEAASRQSYLAPIKKGMSIYEQFQTNNYVGAAKSTFELINELKLSQANTGGDKITSYSYDFGKNKKISISIDNDKFIIANPYTKREISLKFELESLTISSLGHNAKFKKENLDEYLSIAKYIKTQTSNENLLDELLAEDKYKPIETLAYFSESLNIERSQLIQLLSYIQIVNDIKNLKNDSTKQNIGEVFKNLKFSYVEEKNKNIISKYHQKYYSQLTNLLSFFGDVLTAQDSKQLAGVIDSYALPPTSYKLKRKKAHSIDLNGYVGVFAGSLTTFKHSTFTPQFAYGITAPVGVAFTWSRKKWIDNYGVSLDVVDLGNIVNHYLMTPDVGYGREVHFSEVFSLGTTFLLGIRNSPFVFSGGFKFLPLQSFEKNGEVRNNKAFDAGVIHVGLKIDIPLINLYGKDF